MMQELRLVERRDHTLILETEDGSEFTLDVTDEVIGAVQSIQRSQQSQSSETKVRPREVQALLREGISRSHVAERLGIDIEDVERYAGPIEAEFRFIMDQALSVPVRADSNASEESQFFGGVIEERLVQLQAENRKWSTRRDPEEGWMILLAFTSHGIEHDAQWAFEHRKRLLSPVTPDAVNLSRQGDVGDKLIPTLRAVDRPDERTQFDAEPFEQAANHETVEDPLADATELPEFTKSDFERRRTIEQRAIATEPQPQDLGQTSDLLDALRKRRLDRDSVDDDSQGREVTAQDTSQELPLPESPVEPGSVEPEESTRQPINIWAPPTAPTAPVPRAEPSSVVTPADADSASTDEPEQSSEPTSTDKRQKKGRQSIPSWDEILFGTRSEED